MCLFMIYSTEREAGGEGSQEGGQDQGQHLQDEGGAGFQLEQDEVRRVRQRH